MIALTKQTHEEDEITIVDENDCCIGFISKQKAHEGAGILHRAFSIFIFNQERKMLLQQRSLQKYHFAGRWTNACCSHPRRSEDVMDAAHRRLQEEFGFDTSLHKLFSFIYRAHDRRSGLTEYELDHVLIGEFNGEPQPNQYEIADWKWIGIEELLLDVEANPSHYTSWFRIAIDRVLDYILNGKSLKE